MAVSCVIHLQRPLAGPALAETLDGGQCFRWRLDSDGAWCGVSGCVATRLYPRSPNAIEAALASGSPDDLLRHLADEVDWHALADALPRRTDAHLDRCIAAFPGLRILRQPIGEALLCFLCSATKQIVQIKQMVALLADRFGEPLPPSQCHPLLDTGRPAAAPARVSPAPQPRTRRRGAAGQAAARRCHVIDDTEIRGGGESRTDASAAAGSSAVRALPTWARLATVSEKDLRECLLGFRARHVAGVARYLAERPGWLEETAALPYLAAKARLIELPGVGEKIADCVLLFGAGQLEAFPVDVWILRVMEQRYGLHGWKPAQLAQFGRVHFGPLAGLAQQYLFAFERMAARAAV